MRSLWRFRVLSFLVPALLVLTVFWQTLFLRETFLWILKIPLGVVHAVSTEVKNLVAYRFLARENQVLRETVGKLTTQSEGLKAAALENERLRKLLEFKSPQVHQVIPAQVIGRDTSIWTRTVLLDKGKKDSLQVGMPVVSHEGLVGKIIDLGESVSRVLLLVDPNSRVGVVLTESREQGLLVGQGKELCRLEYLSLEANIQLQEEVLTSGVGGIFPKGILVGHVVFIGREPDGMHQYALVRPAVRFQTLEEALCLR